MEELVIQKLDGCTIRRRYENWETFKKEDLEELKAIQLKEIDKINALLLEFDKV